MKISIVRSVLFSAAVYCFIAASSINTNSNSLGDNNSVPPPTNVAKYVTPYGTGNHSGSSWSNAYSIEELKQNLASNTDYFFADSVFYTNDINLINLSNTRFFGNVVGTTNPSKTTFIGGGDISDTLNWSLKCIDLTNSFNITIKNIYIKKYRWFGLRVNSTSGGFIGYNISSDTCGWAAYGEEKIPLELEILSPCAIKLFGDNGLLRKSNIQNSGWDGVQVAGYNVLIDSTTIDSTGVDEPGAEHQGDGIHVFRNPDIVYIINGKHIRKSGRLTVNWCYINTRKIKKSGIEAGYKDADTEKPMLRAFNSFIAGGKGIGITQESNPLFLPFYSTVEGCTIVNLDIDRYGLRIEHWDAGTVGKIDNNMFLCPSNYPAGQWLVYECSTEEDAVTYGSNRWKIGNDLQNDFGYDFDLVCPDEE